MTWLWLCLGAGVGAPARYLLDRAVQGRHDSAVPWGTVAVNVLGSLVLGAVLGAATGSHPPGWLTASVGPGFCGALTTYSTFGYETVRLVEEGRLREAVVNVAVSVVGGVAAAAAGYAAGSGL